MTTINEFYEPLRLILGDLDPTGMYQYTDVMLAGAVRTIFRLGRAPGGYTFSNEGITPDLPNGNDYALIAYEAAKLLLGGEETINYRTRALSVTTSGDRKRDLLSDLRIKIHEILQGDGFTSYQNFLMWARSASEAAELVEAQVDAPLATANITGSGRYFQI